ncbi:Phosphorylase b kinase regulatory subunit alpha, skeletal muscle isoform,Phosphorylase b kinase regulatory subunit beta,Probable phosphorylase b kinase regulatory subunit alpha,Phosphorylase b kinase regulatory subunit alpha, liver isoform [Acanthosepion pharaonis]|uniref:Phosphorylase b kinase regulatory subunit n=1 Tax=Acanthosepion pharaonis TaxID=158019 RepID=A0A812C3D4_ACAPH|nr:Phosphorylase b kinase regulatory subunit alpha, skeletal muscle isoform,Phosphorylase b kinase regulatory subunit beta,Probable phosphorylase b kinase regulatory subunit alpha,Phosphorylase b kinase regulatory subunit alpha, liver isoform [Sepia pharaonis]
MRNRSNSGVRLDYYSRLVNKTILAHQNAVTGLLTTTHTSHAWVRDNVYCITSVWGLALAYRKAADLDEDRSKAFELEQSVVKLMRGLLHAMTLQCHKLEKFKKTQNPADALHAKYNSENCKTVVGDLEWGHLQLDATSLYLLMLAQMTASGLKIIYSLDEVAFIQNLVFYIQASYRIPDYGIWERGDKTNHGLPELNSSSIGMAKAALEAIDGLDLFGSRGGTSSVIHVLPDEAQQCQAILHSMLPRESNSKEIDAGLMTIISFPAFACDKPELIAETKTQIQEKLEGIFGCSRFLRDGYKTPREDPNRLHYEPGELMKFENIECEWPLFFAFFILDGLFTNNMEQTEKYRALLDSLLHKNEEGIPLVPELYQVPHDKVDAEIQNPKTQERKAIGRMPHLWAQSLYILGRLIYEGFLSPGELDPLNRRLVATPRPDVVVQVVILAEDEYIQDRLSDFGIEVQTTAEVEPIKVYPARILSHIYSLLGKNKRLGLTGRPSSEIGLLATSKLYTLSDKILAFAPQFLDNLHFYLPLDNSFIMDHFKSDVETLSHHWRMLGRPVIIFPVNRSMLDHGKIPSTALVANIKKLQSGYINGTRVQVGCMKDFLSTSCSSNLSFVFGSEGEDQEKKLMKSIKNKLDAVSIQGNVLGTSEKWGRKKSADPRKLSRRTSVHGIIRRSRSIQIDSDSPAEFQVPQHLKLGVDPAFLSQTTQGSPKLSRKVKGSAEEASKHLMDMFGSIDINELFDNLRQSESMHDQADIIHYLYIAKGPSFKVTIADHQCTVNDLLRELYEKAGYWKQWWLVRHTAGMLKKRVEDLALAATDLLVRQKQLSVGLPPDREKIITSPLPPDELSEMIFDACGEDLSTAALTQELLIYLAMFIRTEPQLFHEMLRLRVGLIIQVMASEMARTLKCTGEEASDHLLNLSPFEMKTLLHHILSGKEFVISPERTSTDDSSERIRLSFTSKDKHEEKVFARLSRSYKAGPTIEITQTSDDKEAEEDEDDRQGQWLRRRRLDGALNRVPVGFYTKLWQTLRRLEGISICGQTLTKSLTREMTSGEFKFALQVERVLNLIPQPEYRQLMVEGMMVITMLVEVDTYAKLDLNQIIQIDKLVHEANALYLKDQKIPEDIKNQSMGAAGICQHFYDSAPSGRYGTLPYMCRALAYILKLPADADNGLECAIS